MQFFSLFFFSLGIWAFFYDYVMRPDDAVLLTGEAWYALSKESLNLTQAIIERYVYPPLWSEILLPILETPFWLVCFCVAALFGLFWFISNRSKQF